MKKIYEAVLMIFCTIGWWGFVYPELCLTEDVYEEKTEAEWELGEICIKSRIAEYVYQVKENTAAGAGQSRKDSRDFYYVQNRGKK